MPKYSWKLLIVSFFLILNLRQSFGFIHLHDGKECLVYKVFSNATHQHGVEYKSLDPQFTVGFLRLNSDPITWQIFVYLESEIVFQIYINEERYIRILQNGNLLGISDNFIPLTLETPSWYTLQVYLRNNEISIYNPDSIAAIVRGSLEENSSGNISKIKITASGTEYVTLNCLSKCPLFRGEDHGIIEFNLSTSFNLVLTNGDSENSFKYKIKPSKLLQLTNDEQSVELHPKQTGMLSFSLMRSNTSDKCKIVFNYNSKVPQLGSNCSNQDFSFTVFRNLGVSWSFYCEYKNNIEDSSPIKLKFSSGELAAWIIASLSLCGFLIVILALYVRMNSSNWAIENQEMANSESHINHFELTAFPRTKQSTFFKELRKPEEASELDAYEPNINLDKLYPLKFEAEDNIVEREQNEEYFSTLRSNKTSGSSISNYGSQKYSSNHRSGTKGQIVSSDSKRSNESTNNER